MTRPVDLKAAEIFGAVAFAAGQPCVPAHDDNVVEMLEGLPVGKGAVAILSRWSRGWIKASLAA
jgi:hypothetical protein